MNTPACEDFEEIARNLKRIREEPQPKQVVFWRHCPKDNHICTQRVCLEQNPREDTMCPSPVTL
jgi:hypothetical protein